MSNSLKLILIRVPQTGAREAAFLQKLSRLLVALEGVIGKETIVFSASDNGSAYWAFQLCNRFSLEFEIRNELDLRQPVSDKTILAALSMLEGHNGTVVVLTPHALLTEHLPCRYFTDHERGYNENPLKVPVGSAYVRHKDILAYTVILPEMRQ